MGDVKNMSGILFDIGDFGIDLAWLSDNMIWIIVIVLILFAGFMAVQQMKTETTKEW